MTRREKSLPKWAQKELSLIDGDRVVVAAVRTVMTDGVNRFSHAGLRLAAGVITAADPAPPARDCGTYSRRNLDGWVVKRRDLPKIDREIIWLAPSWHGSGSHLVGRSIKAYPVEHRPAKFLTVSATVLESLKGGAVVRFRIDHPLRRDDPQFVEETVFGIQLMRELVGDAHLFEADLSDADYARIQTVDWELLPPGSTDRVLARLAASQSATPARLEVAESRLRLLDLLGHDGYIIGSGSFARYFGVQFGADVVALENLEYGNALYVFEADWERLSQLSRSELIRKRDPSVTRVPHVKGWQSIIRKLLRAKAR